MPFPNQVNVQPAPAVAGDFASTNPRAIVDAGPGGLVAGPSGVTVGRFGWLSYASADTDNAPAQVNSFATASQGAPQAPAGLVHREQQALITTYLTEATMQIPGGFPVTLFNAGDFWVKNDGGTQAYIGQYAFANFADGRVFFGAGVQGSIGTGTLAGSTATIQGTMTTGTLGFTGSLAGNVLTVSNLTSGTIQIGTVLGTMAAALTTIVAQLSGVAGGNGTYAVNIPEQSIPSSPFTGIYGILTVASVAGTIGIGMLTVSGTATSFITGFGTGSGGAGTYFTNATSGSNGPYTGTSNLQTKFIAMSSGAPGELVKISSWVYG